MKCDHCGMDLNHVYNPSFCNGLCSKRAVRQFTHEGISLMSISHPKGKEPPSEELNPESLEEVEKEVADKIVLNYQYGEQVMDDLVNHTIAYGVRLPIVGPPGFRIRFIESKIYNGALCMRINSDDGSVDEYIELPKSDMMLLHLAMMRWVSRDKECLWLT